MPNRRVRSSREGMYLRVLGPFCVEGDQILVNPTRMVARLGSLLAAFPGHLIERDRIVSVLWGARRPGNVPNTLQVHMSSLRRVIGSSRVEHIDGSYRLVVADDEIDAHEFEDRIMRAGGALAGGDAADVVEQVSAAMMLWRGVPFPDIDDAEVVGRRARLVELYENAVEYRLEADLALVRSRFELDRVIANAREQIGRRPNRAAAHRVLGEALTRAGRLAELDDADLWAPPVPGERAPNQAARQINPSAS